jgi:murein DD-endopeptidase MepM/ murein hydrolase activator NlpD
LWRSARRQRDSDSIAIAGVVDFVSREDVWNPKVNDGATRGGLVVAIVGDDGVRYYGSHLSQIADGVAPGVRVSAGQKLGLTGKSGDALHRPAPALRHLAPDNA